MISLIVAMTRNRVIGQHNTMPWHLPADLKHFKAITSGKPVIMGRKTFESIGKALPNRQNIVISRNQAYQAPGCERVSNLSEALHLAEHSPEIFVIGGAQIFTQALPLAHRLYLTLIEGELEGDTFFPPWKAEDWREISQEKYPADAMNAYDLTFITLERLPP